MNKNRIEAFSDGVIAIIITIMILKIKVPKDSSFESIKDLIPTLLSYILSFVFVAIYWNNHHHTFQVVKKIDGGVMWANLHLLFWLSLIPFATNWIGEQHFASIPMAFYGFILLSCAISSMILKNKIICLEGSESILHQITKDEKKGKFSLFCYIFAIPLAFVATWISGGLYIFVALLWIIPNKKIEKLLEDNL